MRASCTERVATSLSTVLLADQLNCENITRACKRTGFSIPTYNLGNGMHSCGGRLRSRGVEFQVQVGRIHKVAVDFYILSTSTSLTLF